jgi:ketosteroid isomerase-like protein
MDDERAASAEIVNAMQAAFSRKDVDAIVALFAEDATIESYLVSRVFERKDCVCRGHAEIRELVRELVKHGTPWDGHGTPLVRGDTVVVEYTSASAPDQKFSVDVIELAAGKIRSLRAYAGWRAVQRLVEEARG